MVVDINIEAQPSRTQLALFTLASRVPCLYIGLSSHAHAAKNSDQNHLTSPVASKAL